MNTKSKPDVQTLWINELPDGATFEVETQTRSYAVKKLTKSSVLICGHPRHCPAPIPVKLCFPAGPSGVHELSEGMSLRYWHPHCGLICTSRIRRIRLAESSGLPW